MKKSLLLSLILAGMCSTAFADDYAAHYREAVTAYQAGDFPAMLAATESALDSRPGYPPMLEIRAMAEALSGDEKAALATLAEIADMQVRFNPEREEFSALKNSEAFEELVHRNAGLDAPLGEAKVLASGGATDFVPEGIAIDADGDVLLGSIRHGDILKLGEAPEILHTPKGNHWSVFGMARADGTLWFVSSQVPEFSGGSPENNEAGTGLFRLDLQDGKLDRHFLPAAKSLGDLLVHDNGDGETVYVSDAAGGVWKFADGEFSELIPSGELVNPQGLAMVGDTLIIADYRGGLVALDMSSGEYDGIGNATSASLYGIDGLIAKGNRLYAVQNGISPARVTEFEYSPAGKSIVAARILLMNHPAFDEPTLLASTHDGIAVVANSHWNRFDEDHQLPDDLSPPTVLLISLPAPME